MGNFLALYGAIYVLIFLIFLAVPKTNRLNFALNSCGVTTLVVLLIINSLWLFMLIIGMTSILDAADGNLDYPLFYTTLFRIVVGLISNILCIFYWTRFATVAKKNRQLEIEQGNGFLL